uniref:PCI domain-containing protein n=1 Tax=Panagrolaimus sp. JU765 TaxID=591449 RepID=A0AC34QPR9_9BILA
MEHPDNRDPVPVDPMEVDKPTDQDELAHLAAQVGDGRLVKMDVNYEKQVDEALPKAAALARSGDVAAAIDSLASLEKQTRLGCDMRSNSRLVRFIVKIAFDAHNWDLLNEQVIGLSKKRALIKFAIRNMIRDVCEMVDKVPGEKERNRLVETLRTVTAGKIYVEVERARLTKRVVEKVEREGKLDEAWNMIMELQVETYGSMEMQEKVQFLLYQMKLSIARKDYVRASIISKKISIKFFDNRDETVQNMRIEYYKYMVEIGLNEKNYLEVCRHYRALFDTAKVQSDKEKVKEVLKCVVLYILLTPHGNEQWDLLHRIHMIRQMELIPEYNNLLELFIAEEVIGWKETIIGKYEKLLRNGLPGIPPTHVFSISDEGNARWKTFQERVGEHNIRMVAKYYTQISFDRMAEILEYPVDEMESFLCNLIVTGIIPDARIHRPSRIINLRARRADVETLDQWGNNVKKLTDILNKVSHLILKEEMVHRHLIEQKK